jgi:hypothetical protein
MPIKEVFDLIEQYIVNKGTKVIKEEALYKEEAPIDYIARGRFCQKCKFFSSNNIEDYCSFLGSVSEEGTCRLFYGKNENVDKNPYTPVIDAIRLEDDYIAIPVIKEGSTIITDKNNFLVTKEFINQLYLNTISLKYNEELISIENKDIEGETLFLTTYIENLNTEEDTKVLKVYYTNNGFYLYSLKAEEQEDLDYINLATIVTIP